MAKAPKLDEKGYRKFGIRDKLAYAAGDAGCNLSFGLKSTVQTFWLVFMMMETGLFSILLLLVQAWDAINDPLIGSLIDNDKRKYKMGKYKTYIFIGACGLLVGGAAVFLPFPNAHTVVKAILFVLGYIIWDAAYTMIDIVAEDELDSRIEFIEVKRQEKNFDEAVLRVKSELFLKAVGSFKDYEFIYRGYE